ncbi:hypothetical protein V6Z12_D05G107400 [Gossypium hirsutum]
MFEMVPVNWLLEMDKFLSNLRPTMTGKLKFPTKPKPFRVIAVTWPSLQVMPNQFRGHPSDAKDLESHESMTLPEGSFSMPFLSSNSASKSDCANAVTTRNNKITELNLCIPSNEVPKPTPQQISEYIRMGPTTAIENFYSKLQCLDELEDYTWI